MCLSALGAAAAGISWPSSLLGSADPRALRPGPPGLPELPLRKPPARPAPARWPPSAHPALGPRSRSAAPGPSGRTLLFSCYRFRPFFESSCWSRPARQSRPLDSAPGESHLAFGWPLLRSTRQGLLERLSALHSPPAARIRSVVRSPARLAGGPGGAAVEHPPQRQHGGMTLPDPIGVVQPGSRPLCGVDEPVIERLPEG
jgi:hypothetical protein